MTSAIATMILVLALAAPAFGQTVEDGYNPTGPTTLEDVDRTGNPGNPGDPRDPVAGEGNGGKLPFTGFDLALFAGAGGLLLLVGVGMRRMTRVPDSA